MGLQMQGTALAWEIYERTRDPLSLGLVGVCRALPVIALALPAGQIVDLLDRRTVLLWTQIAFAIASVLLTVGSYVMAPVWVLYVLVALTGCARVFNGPSRSSLLPQIVRPESFQNAVTWNSGVFQLSATLGPILAGLLIWLMASAWLVYAITAATCVAFTLACSMIVPHADPAPKVEKRSLMDAISPSVLVPGMLDGIRHMWRERTVLGVISLDLFAVLLGGATALMPVYAKEILNVGPVGLGALKSAPYIGALVMAFVLAHAPPFKKAGRAMLLSVAAFGACTIVFGLSTSFWLSIAMLFTLGAVDNISVVIRHVLVTLRTPDELRGRVSAVNSVFIESSNELGGFESGLVAKLFGPVFSVVSGGIGTLIVVAITALALPELRRLGELKAASPEGPPDADCPACGQDRDGLGPDAACRQCGLSVAKAQERRSQDGRSAESDSTAVSSSV